MAETDFQSRMVQTLCADPNIARAECRPLATGATEVWAYDADDVLQFIATVAPSGEFTTRRGFRVTTDTRIGDPPFVRL